MAADRKARTVVFKTLEEASLVEIKQEIEKEIEEGCLVVLQELNPCEYLAEFKEKSQSENLIEMGFDLSTIHVDCNPPRGYYTNVSLMGLRAYIEDNEITSVLEKYGEIKGPIVRLKYKAGHELAGLENGNRLVKIVLNQPSIPYSLKIDGEWCRVIHSGQKPYCSTCSEFGHNRRNCKETVCHKCNEKGHIARDCATGPDHDNKQKQTHDLREATATEQGKPMPQDNDESQKKDGEDDPQIDTEPPNETEAKMDTNGNDNPKQQGLKRPHTSTDTNTDSDTDGFTLVKPRRNKIKPTPNIPPKGRPTTVKNNNNKQIKPPTIINKRNNNGEK